MKSVLILSGGMDSATLAYDLPGEVLCLSFDYGQRHRRELESAAAVAQARGHEHRVLTLQGFAQACPGSSLTDAAVATPHGHYAEPTMRQTVVPGRNAMMLATAFGIAVARGAGRVAIAAHAGDHAIYPDCREEFFVALEEALNLGVWSECRVALHVPYLAWTKTDIVRRGDALGVPYELTWTCYDPQSGPDGELHCGLCGACNERREAFRDAKLVDPVRYAA